MYMDSPCLALSALWVNHKQLSIPSEMFKAKIAELMGGHVSFYLFIYVVSIYWAPAVCQEHSDHEPRTGEHDLW